MRTYLSYLCGYSTMIEQRILYTHTQYASDKLLIPVKNVI